MLSLNAHRSLCRDFHAAERDRRKNGGANRLALNLRESLLSGQVKAEEFSIRKLFEGLEPNGREIVESWDPRFQGSGGFDVLEDGPVTTGSFSNIMGQLLYSRILDAYNDPSLIGTDLVTTIPTQFNGEKVPGIGRIGDEALVVNEGQTYPTAGFSEEWIETPATTKRGFMVQVTKEAVFFDRTGLMLARAGEVGNWLGVNKEKRILDGVLGVTTLYRRNGAAAEATYSDTGSFGDNVAGSNTLVDWTDIENALLLFDALSDPNTGEPISIMPDTLIVPTALKFTAMRILNATEVHYGPGGATSADTVAVSSNPVGGLGLNVKSNQYVKARTSSASTWFIGQPKKAFAYMENWPITVVTAPPNSEDDFKRDVVAGYKASERGAVAVLDPRYMVKCT